MANPPSDTNKLDWPTAAAVAMKNDSNVNYNFRPFVVCKDASCAAEATGTAS
ncbi:hypothetical protein Dip510_001800 [Elusimicrobium posterum]|uniref:hypothetical protein n=1 Tax=Elusimicrobium posterum TaxID=3116653 RepID=UPI003C77E7FA